MPGGDATPGLIDGAGPVARPAPLLAFAAALVPAGPGAAQPRRNRPATLLDAHARMAA
jgi:hypothetical protein